MLKRNFQIHKILFLFLILTVCLQCKEDVACDDVFIEEYIISPFIIDTTNIYFPVDTFTNIAKDGMIYRRARNGDLQLEIIFNEDGFPIKWVSEPLGDRTESRFYTYENNLLKRLEILNIDGELLYDSEFNWEGEHLKSGTLKQYIKVNGVVELQESRYDYQYENDNIIRTTNTYYFENGDSESTFDEYQYDENINYSNYLSHAYLYNFGLQKAPFWFSKNNIINKRSIRSSGTLISEKSFSYTYDEDGKVTDLKTMSNSGSSIFVREHSFKYACYE